MKSLTQNRIFVALTLLVFTLAFPARALAHCDSMNGPVVQEAKRALETGDVTSLMKWVTPDDEQAVRDAFVEVREVRQQGPAAKALSERYFYETVVRLHRASEGMPYTGLKSADTPINPGVLAADEALLTGNPEHLVHSLMERVHEALAARFHAASASLAQADESIEAGREYVRDYVLFTHLAEFIHNATEAGHGAAMHGEGAAGSMHAH